MCQCMYIVHVHIYVCLVYSQSKIVISFYESGSYHFDNDDDDYYYFYYYYYEGYYEHMTEMVTKRCDKMIHRLMILSVLFSIDDIVDRGLLIMMTAQLEAVIIAFIDTIA